MTHITEVSGTIRTSDGRYRSFRLSADGAQQWGANKEDLGETVSAVGDMSDVLRENGHFGDDPVEEIELAASERTLEQEDWLARVDRTTTAWHAETTGIGSRPWFVTRVFEGQQQWSEADNSSTVLRYVNRASADRRAEALNRAEREVEVEVEVQTEAEQPS